MNILSINTLKILRKTYAKIFHAKQILPESINNTDIATQLIYDKLMTDDPCMIARFGSTEMMTLVNFLGVNQKTGRNIWKYIQGQIPDWWWNQNTLMQMQNWSGFFPATVYKIEQFCELMLEDMKEVDILGSWLTGESYFADELKHATKVKLHLLDPYWVEESWTRALEGKKVLVVHPFAHLIKRQYHENRTKLFKNPNILPLFDLQVIQAVQSLGGETSGFNDWFEALNWMKREIDKLDYDICLIGCGAYGFPLAAHVKRQEKKAIHLGGEVQILFGIRGKRWEDPNLGAEWGMPFSHLSMMNEYWVRPGDDLKPQNADKVEDNCYW